MASLDPPSIWILIIYVLTVQVDNAPLMALAENACYGTRTSELHIILEANVYLGRQHHIFCRRVSK